MFGNPLKTHECVVWAKRKNVLLLKPAGSPSNHCAVCDSRALCLTLVIENRYVCRLSDSLLAEWSGDVIAFGAK